MGGDQQEVWRAELRSEVQRQSLGGGLEAKSQKLETNVHVDFENKQNTKYLSTIFYLLLPVY